MTTILAGAQVSPSGDPGPWGGDALPIGAIVDFGGVVEPPGWVFCYGQALARVGIYADLFAIIGTVWGTGDGSTTFNVPDLRGRVLAGRDNMGGASADRIAAVLDGDVLGAAGGTERHTLTVAEMPSHTHSSFFVGSTGAIAGGTTYTNQATNTGATGGNGPHLNLQPTVITNKIIKYAMVSLSSPIPGTGDVVGPAGAVDGDIALYDGNTGKLIKSTPVESLCRAFNAVQNPNFEVDQRRCGALIANVPNLTWLTDRWKWYNVGTMRFSSQQLAEEVKVPGTDRIISNKILRLTLTTAQPTLAAGDDVNLSQLMEGPSFQPLKGVPTSISLLVRSSVANLVFTVTLNDFNLTTITQSLTYLVSLGAADTWTLISLPNVLATPVAGNWLTTPGSVGASINICLVSGTDWLNPTPGSWYSGNRIGAAGMSNFAASVLNSTFDLAFVQHEPGRACTELIYKPFEVNHRECMRFYQKSYIYGHSPGTISAAGAPQVMTQSNQHPYAPITFPVVMAAIPSVRAWNPVNGLVDQLRDYSAGINRGPCSAIQPSDVCFGGMINSGGLNASLSVQSFHWTAEVTGF